MAVIEVIDLTKVYRARGRQKVEALNGVSFTVQQGEIFDYFDMLPAI